jgi:hypothetical protein
MSYLTGTGQQVAQLHEQFLMMMMMMVVVTGTVGGWRWNSEMNTDSSVTIVTRLRPGRQKIHVSIAITGKRFLLTAQGANRM